ncbi:HalOD1 output domain-containing protein [Natrononativus amylolyticus]|uniref:HalOD1 output domain-containing protein n=1 Tax=Natrononativus amylolyticus TaxID=2963434 RepID=UPI0020CFCBE8|nr:HalOD1 output domain-containing protein [Natrononativus amylolyticus]
MGHRGDRIDVSSRAGPSHRVIEAVADAEGVWPEDLTPPEYEPLHAAIDPHALDTLFEPTRTGAARRGGTVTFRYCGYDVTVDDTGAVSLE